MQNVVGPSVELTFPRFDGLKTSAKVDTGAYSGSLSCVEWYLKKEGDLHILYFKPHGSKKFYSVKNYRVISVKSSNGHEEQRFSIMTEVTINTQTFKMRITLANREGMQYPVLIGRRFLARHKFVVDLSKKG